MNAKFCVGERVSCKGKLSTGSIEQVLRFFNEDGLILYKVQIGNKSLLFVEDHLNKSGSKSFFQRLLEKCANTLWVN